MRRGATWTQPERARPTRLGSIQAAGREALAFARQATLLHRDVTATYPRLARPGEDVVVLLHGLFATAGVLRPLRRHLERHAPAHTASFSYAPGPGVATVAETLARLVERLPGGVRLHLVGHSMGGLVVRYYVQELGGDQRVVQTISLASPFGGTRRSRLVPARAGRDIAPGSELLERLRGPAAEDAPPHLSVTAEADALVTEHAALAHGEHVMVRGCGHNGLLYHDDVLRLLVQRVRASRPAPRGEQAADSGDVEAARAEKRF